MKKILVAYSSKTGNTKKIAEAIFEEFKQEADLLSVNEVDNIDDYEYVFVGFWVDRGTTDAKSRKFLERLKNKKVGLFATLGAYPYSIHAHASLVKAAELLDKSNKVEGAFICQGGVDPALLKRFESFPKDDPHYPTPKIQHRHKIAAMHPDEEDCLEARKIFRYIVERDISE